jgi:hypothetical protein
MLRKSDYRGSIRTLTDEQLRRLLTSANYRDLRGVAQAIKREQGRRWALLPSTDFKRPEFRQEYDAEFVGAEVVPAVDYASKPPYNYDGYAGCRA